MRRGTIAAGVLVAALLAVAAWCVWVITSASTLRTAVAANVGALEAVRELRGRGAAIAAVANDPAATAALVARGAEVAALVTRRAPAAAAVADALATATARCAAAPDDAEARRALDAAADAAVGALRAENRRVSLALGDRWRDLNYVAVFVLVLAGSLLAVTLVSQRQRRRAEASEAALRARTLSLQDAARHWAAGELTTRASTRAGADDDFADVLERLRASLAQHVAALEGRNREIAELADDLRVQLIQKTAQLAQLAPAPATTARILAGQYQLGVTLGTGGMGAVFRATRVADGRVLAVKLMKDPGDDTQRARFLREARLLAEVRHPNVLRILDVGIDDGQPYLVTELIEGQNLAADRGPWPPSRAVPVLRAIAAGLAAIHERGIVHRDLKLSNVMIGRSANGDTTTKIVDFGIARDRTDDHVVDAPGGLAADAAAGLPADAFDELRTTQTGGPRAATPPEPTRMVALARPPTATPTTAHADGGGLTGAGVMVGTLRYIAPEARLGGALTTAADVFAFGVLGVRLVTGEFPWSTPAVSVARHTGALPPPSFDGPVDGPPVPATLRALLTACLALEPDARPTAAELGARLELPA